MSRQAWWTKLVITDLVDINLNIRILLGSSYYDDWQNFFWWIFARRAKNPPEKKEKVPLSNRTCGTLY
jgi:hypothetical protein